MKRNGGAKPKVISETLGHSSVAFTMDVYSHIIGRDATGCYGVYWMGFYPQVKTGFLEAITPISDIISGRNAELAINASVAQG